MKRNLKVTESPPTPRWKITGSSYGAFATLVALGIIIAWPVLARTPDGESEASSTQTIVQFVEAFNSRDVDKIMTFFTEDAIYHNMPMMPVQGTEAVRRMIQGFVAPAEKIDWEILNIAEAGDVVLTERIDRFVIKGKEVALPVMGAFEMRDGKIVAWRDYFDIATWQRENAK